MSDEKLARMPEKPDPNNAAGNIACGLMRLLTMKDDHNQVTFGMEELSGGIEEALRYLKEEGVSDAE